jgi:hypothetical protein
MDAERSVVALAATLAFIQNIIAVCDALPFTLHILSSGLPIWYIRRGLHENGMTPYYDRTPHAVVRYGRQHRADFQSFHTVFFNIKYLIPLILVALYSTCVRLFVAPDVRLCTRPAPHSSQELISNDYKRLSS